MTSVLRSGAQRLLAQAVEMEVTAFIAAHGDLEDDAGRRRVVRHGHHRERRVQTGIGPVAVRCPRVRVRGGAGEAGKIRFTSAILPPYLRRAKSIEELLPWLYLKGLSVGFITAAALVHELIEARDDKQLLRFQKKLATYKLLIVDELGFVPLSKTGAELLFEVFSQRYERGSTLVTTNLPFDEWTEVFGSERLTGALLDRLTHHVNILEMNGESYRLNQSRRRQTPTAN